MNLTENVAESVLDELVNPDLRDSMILLRSECDK
jgi:hypothetical protein